MSLKYYSNIDYKMVAKLNFKHSACNYVYKTDKEGMQLGTLYKVDEETYDKVAGIFKGDDSVEIKKGDKVFILPDHVLSQSRIKEYVKSVGANVTKNIHSATVIAGSSSCSETVECRDSQAKYSKLLIKLAESYSLEKIEEDLLDETFIDLEFNFSDTPQIKADFNNGKGCYFSLKTQKILHYDVNLVQTKDTHFLTPACMEIIYYILAKGLKVITEYNVADRANSGLKMEDESTYQSIYHMLNSSDRSNIDLGVNIMTHCDLSGKTIYNVWRLARQFKYEVGRSSYNKNWHYFRQRVNWNMLAEMREEEFIGYAENKDQLDPIILSNLLPKVYEHTKARAAINIENDDDEYYEAILHDDMSYTVQLKEKWKNLLKEEANEHTRI